MSKYIRQSREVKVFQMVAVLFLFSVYVLPQYFGLPLPVFDLTILRIMIIGMTVLIIDQENRKRDLVDLIQHSGFTHFLIPYLITIFYTMVLRADLNAFLNPFIEIYTLYLVVYVVKYVLGWKKSIVWIIRFSYLLTVLGVLEYVIHRSPFSYLETIKGIYTGIFIRSGHYRIMGPCNHSLGYGLLLISLTPFSCYDLEQQRVSMTKHLWLLLLFMVNIFLTGSRSTQAVFLLELGILYMFSPKEDKKKVILIGISAASVFAAFLVVFHNTSIAKYIMLQMTTLLDTALGTSLSNQYGASNSALESSSNYRDQLIKIFQVDWLNPFLGIGRKRSFACQINGSFIKSVDNFYIAEYIRYGYPGLFTYILFLGYFVTTIVKKIIKQHSSICKVLLAGILCYLVNLYWVDSLQTLKYLYLLFAIYYGAASDVTVPDTNENGVRTSIYIRERHGLAVCRRLVS